MLSTNLKEERKGGEGREGWRDERRQTEKRKHRGSDEEKGTCVHVFKQRQRQTNTATCTCTYIYRYVERSVVGISVHVHGHVHVYINI